MKTQAQLERGKRIVEVFKQLQYRPLPVAIQIALLWAVQNGFMDGIPVDRIQDFKSAMTEHLTAVRSELLATISREKTLSEPVVAGLRTSITEFKQTFR